MSDEMTPEEFDERADAGLPATLNVHWERSPFMLEGPRTWAVVPTSLTYTFTGTVK